MKANELMVGDYVIRKNVQKEILIVDVIDSIKDIVYLDLDGLGITEKLENIAPIPLTAEILEKNGWTKHKILLNGNKYMFGGDGVLPLLLKHTNQKKYPGFYDNQITIKYVHEFQHWAKLCGIEKEIKI